MGEPMRRWLKAGLPPRPARQSSAPDVQRTLGLAASLSSRPWSDLLHATPLADLDAVYNLGRRVHPGADFGMPATAILNRVTFICVRENLNPRDLYGRRTTGRWQNLQGVNTLFAGDDLPQFLIADRFCQEWPDGWVLFLGSCRWVFPPQDAESVPGFPDSLDLTWDRAVAWTLAYPRLLMRLH